MEGAGQARDRRRRDVEGAGEARDRRRQDMGRKQDYDDILHHPRHISSRHPQMPMLERAAQFSPFAALTGYGDVIKEAARLTERRPELSETEKTELDYKLQAALARPGGSPVLAVTYFVPDEKKDGGSCRTACGRIRKIDAHRRQVVLEDGTRIAAGDILDIEEAEESGTDGRGERG